MSRYICKRASDPNFHLCMDGKYKAIWMPKTVTMGNGEYRSVTHTRLYKVWQQMINRCYNPKTWLDHPTYKGCTVDSGWHNFQNYAHDILEICPEYEGNKGLQLDKDLLAYGNKVYSKEMCMVVHRKLNTLFIAHGNARGRLPLGIRLHASGCYEASCNDGTGKKIQKYFHNLSDAINCYWELKAKIVQAYMAEFPELSAILMNYLICFEKEHRP